MLSDGARCVTGAQLVVATLTIAPLTIRLAQSVLNCPSNCPSNLNKEIVPRFLDRLGSCRLFRDLGASSSRQTANGWICLQNCTALLSCTMPTASYIVPSTISSPPQPPVWCTTLRATCTHSWLTAHHLLKGSASATWCTFLHRQPALRATGSLHALPT